MLDPSRLFVDGQLHGENQTHFFLDLGVCFCKTAQMVDPGRFTLVCTTLSGFSWDSFKGNGHPKDFALMASRYPKIPRIPNILMPRSRGNVIPDGQPSIKAPGLCWMHLDAQRDLALRGKL